MLNLPFFCYFKPFIEISFDFIFINGSTHIGFFGSKNCCFIFIAIIRCANTCCFYNIFSKPNVILSIRKLNIFNGYGFNQKFCIFFKH